MTKGQTLLLLILRHLKVYTYVYVHRNYCLSIQQILINECSHCEES